MYIGALLSFAYYNYFFLLLLSIDSAEAKSVVLSRLVVCICTFEFKIAYTFLHTRVVNADVF